MAGLLAWLIPPLELSTIFLFVLVLILGLVVKSWTDQPKNLPPFIEYPYPLLGNVPQIIKDPRGKILQWAKKSEGIFSVKFGRVLFVFLSDYDIMKEALVKQADIFSDRITDIMMKCRGPQYAESRGIVGLSGDAWKVHRSLSQTILRQFGMGKNFLALKFRQEVNFYLDYISNLKGKPEDMSTITYNSVSNNICSVVLGKRYDYDDPHFREMMLLLHELMFIIGKANTFFAHKYLTYIPGDIFSIKRLLYADKRIISEIAVPGVKAETPRVDSSDETDNYILAYLREWKKRRAEGRDEYMGDENLEYNVYGLFIAGTETTSTTLLWFMMYMIHHPEIQAKVHKEIVDVIGERQPEITDKAEMHYLNAATMETMRLASILPFSLQHKTRADTTVRGYFIPKGTVIIPHLDAVLLDEKVWKDPLKFNPNNFLDENGKLFVKEQFVAFSLGRRVCLGESLAKMELFLYITGLLQRFELKPVDPNNLPPLTPEFGITCPPEPFSLRFIERK